MYLEKCTALRTVLGVRRAEERFLLRRPNKRTFYEQGYPLNLVPVACADMDRLPRHLSTPSVCAAGVCRFWSWAGGIVKGLSG